MADIERMTITLPADIAAAVKHAVDAGDYVSTNAVVGAALRDWTTRRARRDEDPEKLKDDIEKGLQDMVAGRVKDFDAERIAERGRAILASRSPSA